MREIRRADSAPICYLYKIRHEVSLYVPATKTRFNCYRVGHISAKCRGKARCLYCGNERHMEAAECPKKDQQLCCINCKGEHTAIFKNCPSVTQYRMTTALAATENIPLVEAHKRIMKNFPSPTYAAPADSYSDPRFDYRNFPQLRPVSKSLQNSFSSEHVPLRNHFNNFEILRDLPEENNYPQQQPQSRSHSQIASSTPIQKAHNKKISQNNNNDRPTLANSNEFRRKHNSFSSESKHNYNSAIIAPNGKFPSNPSNNGIAITHSSI